MMLERELVEKFDLKFREFVNRVGGTVRNIQQAPSRPGPDLFIQADIRGTPLSLIAEAKLQGEPRYVRQAADQLKDYAAQFPGAYPIIVSRFISPQTAETLRRRGIGYFDMAGNVLIDFGPLFIDIAGKPNRNPIEKTLKSLFADKSSRILRVLLTSPERSWTVQDLSAEAGVSIGLASRVKKRLVDFDLIPEMKGGIKLSKPGDLLDQWSKAYTYQKNEITNYYSSSDPVDTEKRVASFAARGATPYQMTMFSGAARVAPFVRYNFAAFYFSGSMHELERSLGITATSSGANVWVFRPFDDGVYYGMQNREGISVASNVQLYLDLINFKGRGEEQAAALRERVLRY
jgi:hypothetical protein